MGDLVAINRQHDSPEQRARLLEAITQAADEAPTAEDALRAALARICEHTGWRAGRLQFSAEAGDLSLRTFWHLEDPSRLASYRSLAEARRNSPESSLASQVMLEQSPLWSRLPEEITRNAASPGARGVFAFPIFVGKRVFAVLEFFSDSGERPGPSLLDVLSLVSAQLGIILQRKPGQDELRRSEREYRALFESAHDAILVVDPETDTIVDANQRCCHIYGYQRAELVGLPLDRIWCDSDRQKLRESSTGQGGNFESRQLRKDGREIIVDVAAGPVEFRGRRAVWTANRDITERKLVLEALRVSEERYRLLFDSSPQAMWVFDQETLGFLAVNEAAVKRYGYSREEFSRMTLSDLRTTEEFTLLHAHSLGADGENLSVVRHQKKSGELIDVEIVVHNIDFAGRSARLVLATDVTERLRAEQKLWHAAFYDSLTGLPNRALFMERLGQAQDRARGRDGTGFAVLFLDLDRFKVVNDSMGHRAGDQLLISIARRLERTRRAGDTVARLGGDEFSVLVDGIETPGDAARVAERLQRELAAPFEVNGQEVFTSVSIGIALSGPGAQRPEDLVRDADTAMYRAKAQGAARHAVFEITMHDHAVAALQLESDLRRAIDRAELRVRYQPIVQLKTGRIVGFEALVRWMHPKRGMVAPGEFIPMAEETGVIGPLGRWVLQEACTQMQKIHLAHPRATPLSLSVNLSGRQVLQPDLVEQIDGILKATGFDPRCLRLEITESVLVGNATAATRCLTQLRALGLQLVIDDFGTGYSSLSYLHRMPIDLLKIDASFVRTMNVDAKNRQIVETILLLGRNLGLDVVAEGVETKEQAQALRELGCVLVQGFLFSEALDIEGAVALLHRGNFPFAPA